MLKTTKHKVEINVIRKVEATLRAGPKVRAKKVDAKKLLLLVEAPMELPTSVLSTILGRFWQRL